MKQYFSYFKYLFIILGVAVLVTGVATGVRYATGRHVRSNYDCPQERVYDNAGVLTDKEEENLRKQIAKAEIKTGCDIVLVTIDESVLDYYGFTENTDYNWEQAMRAYADDFYDENNYGFNEIHGDGVLLLDNWYEGEKGTWLSTCGKAYMKYSTRMIDNVLDEVYDLVEISPYYAYSRYVKNIGTDMGGGQNIRLGLLTCIVVALIPSVVFVLMHLKPAEGKKSVTAQTYVEGGTPLMKVRADELINKTVTSRVIQTDSGGSSGSRSSSSGGGGGHSSSGGVSHGGGGRRR